MEIINAHVHMIEKKALSGKVKDTLGSNPVYKDYDKVMPYLEKEMLFRQMHEAGITKCVLYAVDAPLVTASNEYVASLADSDILIGFASVNPLKEDADAELEKAVKRYGMKGCKFHPPLQNFYPNDKRVFPVYEKISKLGIPAVFHIGSTPFADMVKLDQANPILIDEVANRFPELKIMLTHLGTLWHNEAFMVVEKHPNVYIDTAAYPYEIAKILTMDLIQRIGEDKIIFGTDYPTPFGSRLHSMKEFVRAIKKLRIPGRIKEKIFAENFNRMIE